MHSRLLPLASASLALLLACDPSSASDAGPAADAGPRSDGGSVDSGPRTDAALPDAAAPDAGELDGGAGPDAGPARLAIGPRPVEPTPLAEGTLFAAPDGSGTDCTEATPCDIYEVTDQASGGDVVFLRGGVYAIDRSLYFRGRGVEPAPAIFESYPGEHAILDGSTLDETDDVYIRVLGDATRLRRFEVRNMPRQGLAVRSSDHVLEGLEVHSNLLSGIHVHESYETPTSNRNVIRDCIVRDNSGVGLFDAEFADGGNSDGISISSGFDNRVERCLAYGNSDDGIDTWRSIDSYVGYSIIHSNGLGSGNGQGVKAGGAPPSEGTVVERCLSYGNLAAGFDQNSGVAVVFRFNTAWDNSRGYWGGDDTHFERNLATEGDRAHGGGGTFDDNSWERSGQPTFESTDPSSPDFLVPMAGGGFEDLGAYADAP